MPRKPSLKSPTVNGRELRREIASLRQRSDEILLQLDELARRLEKIDKARESRPEPKK